MHTLRLRLSGLLIAFAAAAALACAGEVHYDADQDLLWVVGFPEEAPATPQTLLEADERNGWGQVMYLEELDVYTVGAELWIGDDETYGTYFQVGDAQHPKVTLAVNGTVWVRPPRESPARTDGLPSINNRLTLGDPQDSSIQAALEIGCKTRGEHGVYVGLRPRKIEDWDTDVLRRGSIWVYNSTITAETKSKDHLWGTRDRTDEINPGWYASDVRLVNATLSWFEGCPTYGFDSGERDRDEGLEGIEPDPLFRVRDSTFEHGGTALQNGTYYLRGCTFRDLEVGIREGGSLDALVLESVFEDNRHNVTSGGSSGGGVMLVDCEVGDQEEPLLLRKNETDPRQLVSRGKPVYPAVTLREPLVVKVLDPEGEPVADAMLTVSCDKYPDAVSRGATLTDAEGLTPASVDQAVLVNTRVYRATDDPDKIEETTYTYRVSVTAAGFPAQTVTVDSARGVPEPLVVRLAK